MPMNITPYDLSICRQWLLGAVSVSGNYRTLHAYRYSPQCPARHCGPYICGDNAEYAYPKGFPHLITFTLSVHTGY